MAPKIKYCSTINKFGMKDEHKTFEGITNVSENKNREDFFILASGGKLIAKVPLNWKKII